MIQSDLLNPTFLAIALAHAFVTLFMTGLIWFVQIVHYPAHAMVGPAEFASYQRAHMRRTTYVVAPAMLIEAATATLLLALAPESVGRALPGVGLALLAGVWLTTWGLLVPRHRILEKGFDAEAARALVTINWLRTGLWSARGVIALWILLLAAREGGA